jgi:hypothetical protein
MQSVADLTHPNLPAQKKLILCKKMNRTQGDKAIRKLDMVGFIGYTCLVGSVIASPC